MADDTEVQPLAGMYETVFVFYNGLDAEQQAALYQGKRSPTCITWSGATTYDMTQGDGVYFQISGPDVFIEYANQQGSAGADVSGVSHEGPISPHVSILPHGEESVDATDSSSATRQGSSIRRDATSTKRQVPVLSR